jgi:hypothetical protein
MIERTRNTYLFVVPNSEDTKKLDDAMQKGDLAYNKIGPNTYLGFFEEDAKSAYQRLKREFGVVGEIHWIQLQGPEVTK